MKLTPVEEKFANYYIEEGGNASEAFRRANPISKNWKDEAVWVEASKMCSRPNVRLRIKELQEQAKKRSDITKDDAIQILVDWLNIDPTDFVEATEDGVVVKDLKGLSDAQRKSIKSIVPTANGVRVEFYDKATSLAQLERMLGWASPAKHEIESRITPISREEALKAREKISE